MPGCLRMAGLTFLGRNESGYEEYRLVSPDLTLVLLPGDTFEMGSPDHEAGRQADEGPVHAVSLSPFLLSKYEVTQAQWVQVTGTNPSLFDSDTAPVDNVDWEECARFAASLGLQLPTEAQWEYACRAGTEGAFGGTGRLSEMGWYAENSPVRTQAVGSARANGFGLHDMHGNVWEWCRDSYDARFYERPEATQHDPVATEGRQRVLRGGSFASPAERCRAAVRRPMPAEASGSDPDIGFRPSIDLQDTTSP